jgi:uncharacterized membrane protein
MNSQPNLLPGWFRSGAALLGVDRAIAFTVLGRCWAAFSLPITLFCVLHFLSRREQDYYYTFDSLLALQVVFDLGIAFVVLQFASHEKAHLEWTTEGRLTGDPRHKARLASLLASANRAYSWSATLLLVCVFPAGYLFFRSCDGATLLMIVPGTGFGVALPWPPVAWVWAWAAAVLVTALNLRLSPLLAFIEGCGQVADIARLRLFQQFVGPLLCWAAFALGGRLLAAPALNLGFLLVAVGWLWFRKRGLLRDVRAARDPAVRILWRQEIWPLQWRITVSWLSGFFIFRLVNPVLMKYQPAGMAGQMGMTTKIIDAMTNVCASWMGTKAAPFGALIARRQFAELDRVFFRTLKQSYAVLLLGCAAFAVLLAGLIHFHHPYSERLLGLLPTCLLLGNALLGFLVLAEAVYLRSHKQEPFMWLTVVCAPLTAAIAYFAGRYAGPTGVALGYFLLSLFFAVGAFTYVFQTKRREWHAAT